MSREGGPTSFVPEDGAESKVGTPRPLEVTVEAAVASAEQQLDEVARLAKDADVPESKKLDYVRSIGKKVNKFVQLAALGTAFHLAANLEVRSWMSNDLIKKEQQGSEVSFRHPDQATTHLLNFFTGKEALTKEERRTFRTEFLKGYLNEDYVPKNFDELTEEQQLSSVATLLAEGKDVEWWKNALAEDVHHVGEKIDFDRNLYERVWDIEAKVGAPRIRMTARRGLAFAKEASGWYDAVSNTTYLKYSHEGLGSTLIAEMAHARQRNEAPVAMAIGGTKSWLRTAARMAHGANVSQAYGEEYETPGSVEFEAHEKIEGQLRKQIFPPDESGG